MIKSEELIKILRAMGFEWYDLVDSTYGSGSCFSKVRESDERYYVRFFYFPEAWRVDTDTWRVECSMARIITAVYFGSEVMKSPLKI